MLEDVVGEKRSYAGTFLRPVLARGSGRGKPRKRAEAAEWFKPSALGEESGERH